MTDKDILNDFGFAVMRMVRDRSLEKFEKIQLGVLKSQRAIELHGLLSEFDEHQTEIVKTVVAESIDNAIFNFLCMFEESENSKILVSNVNINDISDGLSGELFTEDGWITRFSQK